MTVTRTKRAPEKKVDWTARFLELFRDTGNVRLSAQGAGIGRRTVYDRRAVDIVFAKAWADAEAEAIDALEATARERALSTSDLLLIFLLKAHRPEKYRDNARVELTGADGGPIQSRIAFLASVPDAELDAAIAEAERLLAAAKK